MKKVAATILLAGLLSGCAPAPVFEPVTDVYAVWEQEPGEVRIQVPEGASLLASAEADDGRLYFCDGYTLAVQTLTGGDLNRSFRELTGFSRERLTVLETQRDGLACYCCAWTGAGEDGQQVSRMVLLDDGLHHYAVTVTAPADRAGDLSEEWGAILNGVTVTDTGSWLPDTAPGTAGSRQEGAGS